METNRNERCDGRGAKSQRPNMNPADQYRMSANEIVSEVEFLIGTDCSTRIAARLGYASLESLLTTMRRAGRHDLTDRLVRTAPLSLDSMEAGNQLRIPAPYRLDPAEDRRKRAVAEARKLARRMAAAA